MIVNPGFEQPLVANIPGEPFGWSINIVSTAQETVKFAGDSALAYYGWESFDNGWGALDPQTLVTTLVVQAARYPESFQAWALNQGVLYLTSLESAPFNTGTASIEAFDGWVTGFEGFDLLSNDNMNVRTPEQFEWSTGLITSSPLATESIGAVDTATFAGSSWTETFTARIAQAVLAQPSTDKLVRLDGADFVGSVGDKVTLSVSQGELPAPLVADVVYYIHLVDHAAIQLRPSPSSPAIDLTDYGAGNQYVNADPDRFWLEEM